MHSTNDGRKLLLNAEMNGVLFTLLCIYGPSDERGRKQFFIELHQWINRLTFNTKNLIIAGDFNCYLNDNDRSTNTHLKDTSRDSMKLLIKQLSLTDIWPELRNDNANQFTWSDGNTESRLDYFFVTSQSKFVPNNIYTKIVISDQIGQRITDHKAMIF